MWHCYPGVELPYTPQDVTLAYLRTRAAGRAWEPICSATVQAATPDELREALSYDEVDADRLPPVLWEE